MIRQTYGRLKIVNDKSLDVLKQYDLDVYQVGRGRGGMILNTDAGAKLFLECMKPDKYYEREDVITQAVASNGFTGIDTFVRNNDNGLVTPAEDGRRYVLKDWFTGRECNVKCIDEICKAVETLGTLHQNLKNLGVQTKAGTQGGNTENMLSAGIVFIMESGTKERKSVGGAQEETTTPMKNMYVRHMKELKMAGNYLRNKKNKSDFEQIAYKNIGAFYDEAAHAVERMECADLTQKFIAAKEQGELCHGNYNYHNVIFCDGKVAVTNFDKYKNECQISDLYQFMRKIMEKYNWDMEIAYKMLDEYDRVKPLSDTDLELLSVLFSFPEKFWKVINFYFNSSKSWIPRKSIEKLKAVVEQNDRRLKFLETIS